MRVERAQYFIAAVETGSFRAAAARCGISQPSLGQQIAFLEEELDVVLLTRSRHGVRPTPAGQALLDPLSRLVTAQDAVHGAAMDVRSSYHGQVRLGGGSVTAEHILAPVVGRLRGRYPGLRFTVREDASADIEASVLAGDLDLAVVTVPAEPAAPGLRRTTLLEAPVGVHVHPDHPLAARTRVCWHDLEPWPIVTMRPGTVLYDLLRHHLPDPDVVVEAMSARTLLLMVEQGIGVGVLARFGISGGAEFPPWIPLQDTATVGICLVERTGSRPSGATVIVRRLLRARAQELIDAARS